MSYSQCDRIIAARLFQALEVRGVLVQMDERTALAGERIADFISNAIRGTRATIWIVSRESLQSDWVALEVMQTLNDAMLWQRRLLIPCLVEPSILKDEGLRARVTDWIDEELEKLTTLVAERAERHIDTDEIDPKRSRLYHLRQNLGTLLERLRGARCLHIDETHFDASVEQLVVQLLPRRSRCAIIRASLAAFAALVLPAVLVGPWLLAASSREPVVPDKRTPEEPRRLQATAKQPLIGEGTLSLTAGPAPALSPPPRESVMPICPSVWKAQESDTVVWRCRCPDRSTPEEFKAPLAFEGTLARSIDAQSRERCGVP